jgi:hypothetical protein
MSGPDVVAGTPVIVRPRRCQDIRHLADMRGVITWPGWQALGLTLLDL